MFARTPAARLCDMTSGRRALTALHLFMVWATMAAVAPALGFGPVISAWGGGADATVPVLALGVPLMVGLLTTAGIPVRTVVPLCGSVSQRLGWAVLVFVLGTLGILAGLAAYGENVDLGSASTRIVLTGVPYAVAAAFFVPSRWVRLGALAVLAAGVAYGGFVGPALAQQGQDEAEVARYRGIRSCCTWALLRRACRCPMPRSARPPSASTTVPSGKATSWGTSASRCARRSRRLPDAQSLRRRA